MLGLAPALRLPAVVLEIVAGIAIGPSGLGWVEVDAPIEVLALVGLAFLLFLPAWRSTSSAPRAAGRARGARLRGLVRASRSSSVSRSRAAGRSTRPARRDHPVATSLGVVVPVLKDAAQAARARPARDRRRVDRRLRRRDPPVPLLLPRGARTARSSCCSAVSSSSRSRWCVALGGAERSRRLSDVLLRLQDTTAQIRIRVAFLLLVEFVALAESLGPRGDPRRVPRRRGSVARGPRPDDDPPGLRLKLEAAGFGFFIPVFFVTSGLQFDLDALFASASTLPRCRCSSPRSCSCAGCPRCSTCRDRSPADGGRGAAPGDVPALHRRRLDDRDGARPARPGDRRGAGRRRLLSVLCFPLAALTVIPARRATASRAADLPVLNPLDSPGGVT